jgi:hypothetical protein
MHVVIVDINEDVLDKAVEQIKGVDGVGEVWGLKVDVSRIDEVIAMREKVFDEFGEVGYFSSVQETWLIVGPCAHGECWYWKTYAGDVYSDPTCGIAE